MLPRYILAIFLILLFTAGCATTGDQGQRSSTEKIQIQKPSSQEIEADVAKELKELGEPELAKEEEEEAAQKPGEVSYDIPITINEQVSYFIDYFQITIPKRFAIWLERSGRYTPMMRKILKQYGLPEDLVYLAMIESGFSCQAYSRAHAVGPWQFIRGTGRRYGLKIDYWVDERRDPVKATHAAAQYLRDLYAEFDSWYLAAAAYNAGEAKIRKALKKYQADNFWSISQNKRRYLKKETKSYVPKMIAAALIAKEPAKYGFDDLNYHAPMEFDKVQVHPGTSLSRMAKLAGISTRDLAELNPELRRWATPPSNMYSLRIPAGQKAAFETAYASLSITDRKARIGSVKIRIQAGDTLGRIAHTHGVPLSDLLAMNPGLNPRRLRIGQVVYVPPNAAAARRASSARPAYSKAAPRPLAHGNKRKITHVVRKGDSLWDIAQAYGINHRDIMRWNGTRSSSLGVGQKLVLYVPQSKAEAKLESPSAKPAAVAPPRRAVAAAKGDQVVHVVRQGDTLWEIAKKYQVSHRDIMRWNKKRTSRLSLGQKLVIYPGKSGPQSKSTTNKPAAASQTTTYKVKRGDSLWTISQKFKVSPSDLRRWNGLDSSRITPGDTLMVRLGGSS